MCLPHPPLLYTPTTHPPHRCTLHTPSPICFGYLPSAKSTSWHKSLQATTAVFQAGPALHRGNSRELSWLCLCRERASSTHIGRKEALCSERESYIAGSEQAMSQHELTRERAVLKEARLAGNTNDISHYVCSYCVANENQNQCQSNRWDLTFCKTQTYSKHVLHWIMDGCHFSKDGWWMDSGVILDAHYGLQMQAMD